MQEREIPFQKFYIEGKCVCRKCFCFLHGIEKKKMLAIAKPLDVDGSIPRVHGRVNRYSLLFSFLTITALYFFITEILCVYLLDLI